MTAPADNNIENLLMAMICGNKTEVSIKSAILMTSMPEIKKIIKSFVDYLIVKIPELFYKLPDILRSIYLFLCRILHISKPRISLILIKN